MITWRLLKVEEYPKPIAQVIKLARRIVDDDELNHWLEDHSSAFEEYTYFIDLLAEIATQPFYTLEGDLDETG